MAERFLSGVESRFSDTLLGVTFKTMIGGQGAETTDLQRQTIANIVADETIGQSKLKQSANKKFSDFLGGPGRGRESFDVLLDAEQVSIPDLQRGIDEATSYIANDVGRNILSVQLRAVSGNDLDIDVAALSDTVIERPGVEANFGFDYKYSTSKNWDDEYFRNNSVDLSASNPDIRQITDLESSDLSVDTFNTAGDDLLIQFDSNWKKLTQEEMRTVQNGIDGFVRRGVEDGRVPLNQLRSERQLITSV